MRKAKRHATFGVLVLGIVLSVLGLEPFAHWLERQMGVTVKKAVDEQQPGTMDVEEPASPHAAVVQEFVKATSSVVRISGTRDGTSVSGTGFVVGLDHEKATIVTASHVVEGAQNCEVTFGIDRTKVFPGGIVVGIDTDNPNGLAVLQVLGVLPAGVTTLSFEVESRPLPGEGLYLLGFSQMALEPHIAQRVLSARRGTLLLIDQEVSGGFAGGPVLQDGEVVGVITSGDSHTTYAVSAVVALEALKGWGVETRRVEPARR